MRVTLWEYATPIFGAFLIGIFAENIGALWSTALMLPVAVLQIFILDRRDPNGLINGGR